MELVEEHVVLVDSNDQTIGTLGKLEAHKRGALHRAFSVFVFDKNGEIILQQRAMDKYHSSGLWTNTCCSHPRPGEELEAAVHRRLKEEMGFDTEIIKAFDFVYKHEFDNGLVEHEFDHVFIGYYSGEVNPNPAEVMNWKTVPLEDLKIDIVKNQDKYTYWFRMVVGQYLEQLNVKNQNVNN